MEEMSNPIRAGDPVEMMPSKTSRTPVRGSKDHPSFREPSVATEEFANKRTGVNFSVNMEWSAEDLIELGCSTRERATVVHERYVCALQAMSDAFPPPLNSHRTNADAAVDFALHEDYGQSQGVERMNYAIIGSGLFLSFTASEALTADHGDDNRAIVIVGLYILYLGAVAHTLCILFATSYLAEVTIRAYGELDQLVMCKRYVWLRNQIQNANYIGILFTMLAVMVHQYDVLDGMGRSAHGAVFIVVGAVALLSWFVVNAMVEKQSGVQLGHQKKRVDRVLERFCKPESECEPESEWYKWKCADSNGVGSFGK